MGKRRVGVRADFRSHRLGVERPFELGGRLARLARLQKGDAEADARPRLGEGVAVLAGVDEERPEALLRSAKVVAEPKLELRVGEPELALLGLGHTRAGLQVLERNPELAGENPERLQRRIALARLDARDVGVRNARPGELPLRQTPLEPEAANSRPDRLLAGRCVEVVHQG